MSRMIIKKPNGKYAIWSSIVDDFVADDITKEEYIECCIEQSEQEVRDSLEKQFSLIDSGSEKELYGRFTISYEEACRIRDERHMKNTS